MKTYHKIQTVFKRDPETKYKTLLTGEYSLPAFESLESCRWTFTEKVDGTNVRVILEDGVVSYRGKTDNAQMYPGLLAHLVANLSELKLVSHFGDAGSPVCLYGEGYGAKIQKGGGLYREDQGFILFDVKVGEIWLSRESVEDIAQTLELPVVPIIHEGTLASGIELVKTGFTSQVAENGVYQAEGLVMFPSVPLQGRLGRRVISKIKARDFR